MQGISQPISSSIQPPGAAAPLPPVISHSGITVPALPTQAPPVAAHAPHLNARVFKLQFDARRIICCSQDPKIVGWDFANGDAEIEEAAGFFGGPA
jgi:F-box and WD-40 domain protein 1/11